MTSRMLHSTGSWRRVEVQHQQVTFVLCETAQLDPWAPCNLKIKGECYKEQEKMIWHQSFSPKCGDCHCLPHRLVGVKPTHEDQQCLSLSMPILPHSSSHTLPLLVLDCVSRLLWRLASLKHCKLLLHATGKSHGKASERHQGSISWDSN